MTIRDNNDIGYSSDKEHEIPVQQRKEHARILRDRHGTSDGGSGGVGVPNVFSTQF